LRGGEGLRVVALLEVPADAGQGEPVGHVVAVGNGLDEDLLGVGDDGGEPFHCTLDDQEEGGAVAVEHLPEHGVGRLALVGAPALGDGVLGDGCVDVATELVLEGELRDLLCDVASPLLQHIRDLVHQVPVLIYSCHFCSVLSVVRLRVVPRLQIAL
jgi:hypothetical protein